MKFNVIAFLTLAVLSISSCNKNKVYESNKDIPNNSWFVDSVLTYTFAIDDASVGYDLSLNVRNSVSYPYYNLFLRYTLSELGGNQLSTRQVEILLMDSKTGRPLGDGLGDIFDNQFVFLENYKFPAAGKYKITYKQYMRQDPLPDIMSVGLKVEKSGK